jgi:hypothetical protein
MRSGWVAKNLVSPDVRIAEKLWSVPVVEKEKNSLSRAGGGSKIKRGGWKLKTSLLADKTFQQIYQLSRFLRKFNLLIDAYLSSFYKSEP